MLVAEQPLSHWEGKHQPILIGTMTQGEQANVATRLSCSILNQ